MVIFGIILILNGNKIVNIYNNEKFIWDNVSESFLNFSDKMKH
jgi:hypothetical protein